MNVKYVKTEVKKKIKNILEVYINENTTYSNLWNTIKVVLRGKFKALTVYMKKHERSHISDLMEFLEALEQQEEIYFQKNRW